MEHYTIEDIELIRRKSGISYQEAVALLDYHNGNVARALVDLERNGRIKPESAQRASAQTRSKKSAFSSLMTRLYQCRLKIKKGSVTIANFSLLFSAVALIISPHIVILGIILCLILGYHISFVKRDADFATENLERMVKNAAQNVKSSVGDIARGFSDALNQDDREQKPSEPSRDASQAVNQSKRSFYQSNPAATTAPVDYTGRAPVLQVPVQVESQDGKVEYSQDQDGYGNATIE